MNLHKCSHSDLDTLVSIGRTSYYDSFHTMNSIETMKSYLDEAFDPLKIKKELSNPESKFYLLYENDVPAAYIKINSPPAQTDLNDPESLELERIYVNKKHKGKGYGSVLIDKTISVAREKGCAYVWLGVWEKNEAAIGFYKKMGFEIFDRHTFRMGDELQDDLLMKKHL